MELLYNVELFGGLRVFPAGSPDVTPVTRFRTRKTASLFAYLAFHAGKPISRSVLIDMFWPDATPAAGRHNLNMALTSLRGQLEGHSFPAGAVLAADRNSAGLTATVASDVSRLESLLNQAARVAPRDPARAADLYAQAAQIFRGELLPGYYDPWIVPEQERMTVRVVEALQWLSRYAQSTGDAAAASLLTRQAVALDPLRGEAKTAPGLQSGRPPAAPAPLPEPVPAPAGNKRGASAAPPIPLPLTRFFGRQGEITELLDLLSNPSERLICLTGPGGVGKTRLAREVLRMLRDDGTPARFRFTDLASVTDAAQLPAAVARTMGLANPPPDYESALEAISAAFRELPNPILLLDGFEHLLPDGAAWAHDLLVRTPELTVLATSRQRLLVDGERVLSLDTLPVPRDADAASDPQALLRDWTAVSLFHDRARAARPDWNLTPRNAAEVVRLLARLEGIPLAIELAATRVQILTPAQMLAQLDADGFGLLQHRGHRMNPRHHSLRETIAWSVGLLSAEDARLFDRLSVFRDGFDLEAAAEVGEGLPILDGLGSLCDASLLAAEVGVGPGGDRVTRFRFLEIVREFAAERLRAAAPPAEKQAAEASHARHYARLATGAEPKLQGAEQAAWFHRLAAERANLRAALAWFDRHAAPADDAGAPTARDAADFCASLIRFWMVCGPTSEGRRHLEAAFDRARPGGVRGSAASADAAETDRQIKLANGAGIMALGQGDLKAAHRWFRFVRWLTRAGTPCASLRRRAGVLNNLAIVADLSGNPGRARALYEATIRACRAAEEWHLVGTALANLGIIAAAAGDWDGAEAAHTESLQIARRRGDFRAEGIAQRHLGELAHVRNDLVRAEALYRQSLRIQASLGDIVGCAHSLFNLALVAEENDDPERAWWLSASAMAAYTAQAAPLPKFVRERWTPWSEPKGSVGVLAVDVAARRVLEEDFTITTSTKVPVRV